jgi:hypothetical protein
MNSPSPSPSKPEEEHQGPIWKHPYLLYILLTAFLFLFLIFMGWLALKWEWIPNRGTHS